MRILGIVAEYNPFHKGHEYHLSQSMKATGADRNIAIMSGNFTQRGEAAIMDKWTRARLAVDRGINLAIELPFYYACNQGDIFAKGAIDILAQMGVTDIAFGSETGDYESLASLIKLLTQHRDEVTRLRLDHQAEGNSFVRSQYMAVEEVLGDEQARLMSTPNNILAIEYIKRINYWNERGYNITGHAIKRYASGYNDINETAGYAGATRIREKLRAHEDIAQFVPQNVAQILGGEEVILQEEQEERLYHILRGIILRSSPEELAQIYCVGEGIENAIKKQVVNSESLKELVASLVSRRYTEATIRRILTYVLVNMKDMPEPQQYARILAADSKGREIIKMVTKNDVRQIPVITNVNQYLNKYSQVAEGLSLDCRASDIYNLIMGRNIYQASDRVVMPYMK